MKVISFVFSNLKMAPKEFQSSKAVTPLVFIMIKILAGVSPLIELLKSPFSIQ